LVSPFPRADLVNGQYQLVPLLPQHALFVETVKENRVRSNTDRIVTNGGKMIYDCVWGRSDNKQAWLCIFALDIYDCEI
jgi:hypothetical protein